MQRVSQFDTTLNSTTADAAAAAVDASSVASSAMVGYEPFTPREFRDALGRFATGVTVVTMHVRAADGTEEGGSYRTYGITVNAFMSVSLDPPLVAISIDKKARAHATLQGAERFGVSVLAAGQQVLSDLFAGRPVEEPLQPFEQLAGFPVLRGALAQLVCSAYQEHEVGDHTIFVGKVEALRHAEGTPLLFFKGQYG